MRSLALIAPLLALAAPQPSALLSTAERTNYEATSRHAEVEAFCRQLAAATPLVHVAAMGKSKEGRELPLLVIADPPVKSPEEARQSGKAVVMAFANIHAGEVEGKEALQMLARDLVLPKPDPLLKKLVILLNPNFNADGNEKIDPKNRPHQGGPKQGVGLRANADGLDLNRDFVKLKSPEVRALVKCWNDWDPLLIIDCHSTNGTYHRYLITYDGPRVPAADASLRNFTEPFLADVGARTKALGGWDTFFYGDLSRDRAFWTSYPPQPRYGIQAAALRNRIGVLSEAYTYADFKDRVLATRDFVRANFSYVADHADEVRRLCAAADEAAIKRQGPLVLRHKSVPLGGRRNVLGFGPEKKTGASSPSDVPMEIPVTYLGGCEPTLTAVRPLSYLIPPDQQAALEVLRLHGIELEERKSAAKLEAERFLVDKVKRVNNRFQGGENLSVEGEWQCGMQEVPAGWFEAKAGQRLGNLAGFLLEPQSDDGLLTWDFFGAAVAEGKPAPVLRRLK